MDQLLLGYDRFRRTYWRHHQHEFVERAQQGQSPWAMVVACCDSRVPPEIIFDCAPGEIFVVRSIANLIPTYAPDMANHGTSAALEYAVKELKVRQIILQSRVVDGMRNVHGFHFDMVNGDLEQINLPIYKPREHEEARV